MLVIYYLHFSIYFYTLILNQNFSWTSSAKIRLHVLNEVLCSITKVEMKDRIFASYFEKQKLKEVVVQTKPRKYKFDFIFFTKFKKIKREERLGVGRKWKWKRELMKGLFKIGKNGMFEGPKGNN